MDADVEFLVAVGGRLTDLEFLARRLKTGQTPKRAIAEMIEQSANEIMKMYLLTVDKGERKSLFAKRQRA